MAVRVEVAAPTRGERPTTDLHETCGEVALKEPTRHRPLLWSRTAADIEAL